jgi:hypothetical protein
VSFVSLALGHPSGDEGEAVSRPLEQ